MTGSMEMAIAETNRRRGVQEAYNTEHDITPTTVKKSTDSIMQQTTVADAKREARYISMNQEVNAAADPVVQYMSRIEIEKLVKETQKQMEAAAKDLDFIEAARLRDYILQLKAMQ